MALWVNQRLHHLLIVRGLVLNQPGPNPRAATAEGEPEVRQVRRAQPLEVTLWDLNVIPSRAG
jgi:hypothetical protein